METRRRTTERTTRARAQQPLAAKAKRLSTPARVESLFPNRDAEIRTRGLTHPKGARYQAAPHPVVLFKYLWKIIFVKSRGAESARERGKLLAAGVAFALGGVEQRDEFAHVFAQATQGRAAFVRERHIRFGWGDLFVTRV